MVKFLHTKLQVEVTKFEELEETHAELKLKQTLWDSRIEWEVNYQEWMDVSSHVFSMYIPVEDHVVVTCLFVRE